MDNSAGVVTQLDLMEFFGTYPQFAQEGMRVMPVILLVLARVFPFVQLSFFLASRNTPVAVRVGISFGIFLFILPTVLISTQDLTFGFNTMGFIFKEVFIGLMLGMLTAIPFYTIMLTGMLIDNQRGAASLMGSDPVMMIQDSPLGMLFVFMLINIYWFTELPFSYIEILAESFQVVPIDGFLPKFMFEMSGPSFVTFQTLFAKLFATGIQLAAPALIVLLLTDMFLGISNRLAPNVMISFLAQALKAAAGLGIVWLGWTFILEVFTNQAFDWAKDVYEFSQLLKY